MPKPLAEMSMRRRAGILVFLVVVGLCVWAVKDRGFFDGITLFVASLALLLALLQLLPSRPKLRVTARDDEAARLQVQPSPEFRPLEIEEIIDEQSGIALSELPRRIKPKLPPNSPLAQLEKIADIAALGAPGYASTVSDETIREFEKEVYDYGDDLRLWLTALERSRVDRQRLFEGQLRLHEVGHAFADHLHLRLHFPDGFELDESPPRVGSPPPRPEFQIHYPGLRVNPIDLPEIDVPSIRLPGTDKPEYSIEEGRVTIDYDLGRLNQSDYRDVPSFRLRSPGRGSYLIDWEATAAGLSKPAKGQIEIEIKEPLKGQPIETLNEADAERERYDFV